MVGKHKIIYKNIIFCNRKIPLEQKDTLEIGEKCIILKCQLLPLSRFTFGPLGKNVKDNSQNLIN